MMAVLLALPVHADTNVSLNYVWDGTQWIPWLATSDGRPKVDINLFNISAGSANISGNFTVDTGTLFVDSLNNRVGIGTSTPQHTLHVNGTLNVTGASYLGTSSIDAGNITTDRLGIGISGSPNQALQIVGHANISGTVWSNGMNITPNNVSLLYGWNNTDFIPLLTTGAGVLKLQTEQALAENANTLLIGGNGTDITINASGTGARPLIVRGFPGQTVNLTEWRNSANTVNAFVTHFGGAYFNDSVGIGTAVPPGTILDVLDSGATGIRIRRSVGNADTRMFSDTSIGYLGTQSNHPLRIQTNAVDRVTIDTSGNVGIGTVAPRRKLQINGSAGVSLETNESVYLAIGENQKVGIGLNMTSPLGTVHINSSNALGALRIENTTGTQLLFINGSSGNVGIGTTVPSAILDVVGNVELNGNVTGIDDITLSDVTDLTNYITGPGFRSLVIRTGDANDANDELGFEVDTNQADPGVTYTRVMTMDWTGNVGIGTTSPYRRLQVNGTGGALEVNDSVYLAVSGGNVGIGTATLDTDTRLQVDRSTHEYIPC
ncbi:MAG: hypothetical protein HYY37_03420 [Candidatus Aenigmarchaeota archaeon]|nr:hypothetical protein [Candidatus Aenigmarchaeota archaeon]